MCSTLIHLQNHTSKHRYVGWSKPKTMSGPTWSQDWLDIFGSIHLFFYLPSFFRILGIFADFKPGTLFFFRQGSSIIDNPFGDALRFMSFYVTSGIWNDSDLSTDSWNWKVIIHCVTRYLVRYLSIRVLSLAFCSITDT